MSQHKFKNLFIRNMDQITKINRGVGKWQPNYPLLRLFSPFAYTGSTSGEHDTENVNFKTSRAWKHRVLTDRQILTLFYQRFPGLKVMPQMQSAYRDEQTGNWREQFPMQTHIDKFKAYLKQGYSKEKALNSVEKELLEIMER